MRILSVADHVDPLVYSHNIRDRFPGVDCIIGAGDLDIWYYEYIVSCLNKKVYFVFGNHNLRRMSQFRKSHSLDTNIYQNINDKYFGSICIDGKVVKDKRNNLIIAGLGGSKRYNNGIHQFNELQMCLRAIGLLPKLLFYRLTRGCWLDVLVTHAPPAGIHDRMDPCHKGFTVFLHMMKLLKPQFLIHGHVHLYNINEKRITRYKDTMVVNAYNHVIVSEELIDKEKALGKNDYMSMQADSDFKKARKRALIDSIKSLVDPSARQLLSFHDIRKILKPAAERYLGMKTVDIKNITGSEDRYQDFSRDFFPKKEHLRQRWMNIDRAYLNDVILPPINLIKIGDIYFVRDGNHRVSVARSQGVQCIDAEVVEFTADIQIDAHSTRQEIMAEVLQFERNNFLKKTKINEIIPIESMSFTSPGRWHEILNHIEGHKYFLNINREDEISFDYAVRSWYDNLYIPIVENIQQQKTLSRFPDRTDSDLYLWIIKHWDSLKKIYGSEFPLSEAVQQYTDSHGKSHTLMKVSKYLRGIFQRKVS